MTKTEAFYLLVACFWYVGVEPEVNLILTKTKKK